MLTDKIVKMKKELEMCCCETQEVWDLFEECKQEIEKLQAENAEFRKTILDLQEEIEFYKTNDNVCAVTVKGKISEKASKYDMVVAENAKLQAKLDEAI